MNEAQFQLAKIEALLRAYVDLNRLHAEPGDKAHMLASCIYFLQRQIREALK